MKAGAASIGEHPQATETCRGGLSPAVLAKLRPGPTLSDIRNLTPVDRQVGFYSSCDHRYARKIGTTKRCFGKRNQNL